MTVKKNHIRCLILEGSISEITVCIDWNIFSSKNFTNKTIQVKFNRGVSTRNQYRGSISIPT